MDLSNELPGERRAAAEPAVPGGWFGWAIYLGISWTWCIGMFLPVLLIRDYGTIAFWIFAIPNVVGAAAMGWTISSPAASAAFVRRHEIAVRAFSLVTIAFHAFFVGWICGLKGDALWPLLACLILIALMLPLARRRPIGGAIGVAVFALLSSTAIGGALITTLQRIDLATIAVRRPSASPSELAGLSMVCVLGFALCPYLDSTFHFARQNLSTSRQSKWGFAVGFGVIFAAMIGLTYLYADVINLHATMRGLAGTLIVAHMVIQAATSISLHAATPLPRWPWPSLLPLAAAGVGLALAGWLADNRQGEFMYRSFMSFYGLIAPAYVWICGVCSRGGEIPRRARIATAIAIIAASPFYWLAFMQHQMAWAAVGMGIVLIIGIHLQRRPSQHMQNEPRP